MPVARALSSQPLLRFSRATTSGGLRSLHGKQTSPACVRRRSCFRVAATGPITPSQSRSSATVCPRCRRSTVTARPSALTHSNWEPARIGATVYVPGNRRRQSNLPVSAWKLAKSPSSRRAMTEFSADIRVMRELFPASLCQRTFGDGRSSSPISRATTIGRGSRTERNRRPSSHAAASAMPVASQGQDHNSSPVAGS